MLKKPVREVGDWQQTRLKAREAVEALMPLANENDEQMSEQQ
jgi:hypothetical protein